MERLKELDRQNQAALNKKDQRPLVDPKTVRPFKPEIKTSFNSRNLNLMDGGQAALNGRVLGGGL